MYELWLNYRDQDGVARRVRVEKDKFTIGRHSNCDLAIPDSRLSRLHATIERFGDRFEISDKGSSNGTDLNATPVFDPEPISNGSVISLGGFEVRAEITEVSAVKAATAEPTEPAQPAPTPARAAAKASPNTGGIPIGLILVAPVLALVLVVGAGGAIYLFAVRDTRVVTAIDTPDDPIDIIDSGNKDIKDDPTPSPANKDPLGLPTNSGPTPTPTNLTETAKIEVNGTGFLRKIGQNDQKVFMTGDQARRVSPKIKQFSGSSALAENINSARKNAAQLKTIAAQKNFKPQFLAVAAIARLGNSKGDVVQTAQAMSEVLDKLSVHLGTELADDCLLLIAAYDQGAAGETMKMRNMLQDLANKTNESSRTIRTIWFLQKQNKITQAEFDRALTFLSIGTIVQNPKDFNVNAEALDI